MASRSRRAEPASKWTALLFPTLLYVVLAAAIVWPTVVALPPRILMESVFHAVMYPLLTGERSQQRFLEDPSTYFLIVAPAVLALLLVLYVRLVRTLPHGTYLGRAGKVVGLIVLALYALNYDVQGGLGIPLALLYAGGLLAICWEAQRDDRARRLLEGAVWAGLGFFASSGIAIALTRGETRFDLQRLHGLYGYLWMAAAAAYLIAHITEYEGKRETSLRNWGYVATAILTAAALTGLARLHGGGETTASGLWPHVITGVAAVAAVAGHVGRSWRKRGLATQPGTRRLPGTLVLGCLALGMLLPAVPVAFGRRHDTAVPGEAAGAALLRRSPRAPVTASGPNASTLAADLVSIREAAIGCGKTGGCHVDAQAQWERSAHRFSANAAYRRTVGLLIEEQGIEQARLCAGCHDPVPLLTGQIVEGSGYPFEASEGVTCVVCHSMRPGTEARNGHYVVAPSPTFEAGMKDHFTAYMMVELYRDEHRADFLGASLTDNTMCASCHNLTTEHLALRRTFDEWKAGPFGPGQAKAEPCTGCHMPEVGDSYLGFFELHDHRMPAANVALATLRGESTDTEQAFISRALGLEVSITRRSAQEHELEARLSNREGGHVFPTAPRDLVDYWFEIRFEGGREPSDWLRLDPASLFDERLVAADGSELVRHEIWRAVEKHGPEGIAPGETREYSYPLPPVPPDVERISVRLMHRRYQAPFLEFLASDPGGLYTAPIELLHRTIEWRASDPRVAG